MTGTPEGSTESGFMEKLGIEPANPWFTRLNAYPLHHGGFSINKRLIGYAKTISRNIPFRKLGT